MTAERAYAELGRESRKEETVLGRFWRRLEEWDALETTEIVLPGDARRFSRMLEVREAVPAAVNETVARAKHTFDPLAEKVGGDIIVPYERVEDLLVMVRKNFERRNLDYGVWGHISDGNLHPNLIPRRAGDVAAGKEALLEIGRSVTAMGGCPLAEHGVGRSAVKQQLLRQLYGDAGIAQMKAVKNALDPEWKLAPGVLFSPPA
jgi:FAD/FMN-containing dehydrogenase